jgi:hypothetical protein
MMGAAVIVALYQEFEGVVDEDCGTLNRLHLFMTGPGPADGERGGDGEGVSGVEKRVVFVDIEVL